MHTSRFRRRVPWSPCPEKAISLDLPESHTSCECSGGFRTWYVQSLHPAVWRAYIRRDQQKEILLATAGRRAAPSGCAQGGAPRVAQICPTRPSIRRPFLKSPAPPLWRAVPNRPLVQRTKGSRTRNRNPQSVHAFSPAAIRARGTTAPKTRSLLDTRRTNTDLAQRILSRSRRYHLLSRHLSSMQ